MATTSTASEQLRKGSKVVARSDLRDVPEGTQGKVIMVSGLTWIRYWVRFDNGVSIGSINRADLATASEWQRHLRGEDEPAADESTEDAEAAGGDGGGDGGGGGVSTPSGTVVPQLLIDRAKAARARLAA